MLDRARVDPPEADRLRARAAARPGWPNGRIAAGLAAGTVVLRIEAPPRSAPRSPPWSATQGGAEDSSKGTPDTTKGNDNDDTE
jgi:hypothetical protein